jgi:replication factor A1
MSGNEDLAIVKATLSYINTKNFCNTVCPLVVNGRQCNRKVGSNGDGWWHCDRCNQTFVNCDYKYMVLVQLQDSTGIDVDPLGFVPDLSVRGDG